MDFDDRHDLLQVNQVAYEFATTKDMNLREELQLRLLEYFHGYLLKYLNMIIFGQLPALYLPQGKDAKTFLSLLIDHSNPSHVDLRNACKSLHLAFKEQQTSDDVYDILIFLFIKVCAHYDPLYPKKTEKVCQLIESQTGNPIFRSADISAAVGFDASGCIRVLVNGKYISSIQGPKKTVLGYQRGPNWPPPEKFFQHGKDATGFAFVPFAQRFFRWYLGNYISEKRGNIENKKDVLQLEHIYVSTAIIAEEGGGRSVVDDMPHPEGAFADANGVRWASDISMLEHWRTFDVSRMDDEWVAGTDDFLFRALTPDERYMLQLIFVKECNWTEITKIFQCDSETARNRFNQTMFYLEGRSKIHSVVGDQPKATAPLHRKAPEIGLLYA
jgi:hypothetical protein